MSEQTNELTSLNPELDEAQRALRQRFKKDNATALKGQIVFVGSSLMEIFPIEKMQAEQDLGLSKVIYNRGIRATTTADLLEHIELQILDLQPSKVFINIGSNDIGSNVPEAAFLANYDEILRRIKDKLPKAHVYVMAYYPVNRVANFGGSAAERSTLFASRNNEAYESANEKLVALAATYDYTFINVNHGLADAQGNLQAALTFDGTHLLPAGYEIVFANMKQYLD